MTDRNCDTCKHEYEAKKPEIRVLSKEQCEYLYKQGGRDGYIRNKETGMWCFYGLWLFNASDSVTYGLPITDPFWSEWDAVQAKPDIRAFTQAEFDRAFKDKETWKRVLFTANDGISWDDEEGNGGPIRGIATKHPDWYGLPRTDPFWKEHYNGEPCELPVWILDRDEAIKYRFEYTGEYRCADKNEWVHDSYHTIWKLTSSITSIKYWILRAIPKDSKRKAEPKRDSRGRFVGKHNNSTITIKGSDGTVKETWDVELRIKD